MDKELNGADTVSVESSLVSGGQDRTPGAPLNVPLVPASNFILGDRQAYARDDGTPTWEALEEIVGGMEGGGVSFVCVGDGRDCRSRRVSTILRQPA